MPVRLPRRQDRHAQRGLRELHHPESRRYGLPEDRHGQPERGADRHAPALTERRQGGDPQHAGLVRLHRDPLHGQGHQQGQGVPAHPRLPRLAIRQRGMAFLTYGVEGVDFTRDANGIPTSTDKGTSERGDIVYVMAGLPVFYYPTAPGAAEAAQKQALDIFKLGHRRPDLAALLRHQRLQAGRIEPVRLRPGHRDRHRSPAAEQPGQGDQGLEEPWRRHDPAGIPGVTEGRRKTRVHAIWERS